MSPDSPANAHDPRLQPAQVFLIFDTDKEYQDMIKVETQEDSFGDMVVYWTDIMHLHEDAIYLKDNKGMVATFVKDDDTSETRVPLRVLYSRDPFTIIVHKPPPDLVVLPLSRGLRIEPERTLSASTRIRKNLYRALFRANSVPTASLESTGAYHHQTTTTTTASTSKSADSQPRDLTKSLIGSILSPPTKSSPPPPASQMPPAAVHKAWETPQGYSSLPLHSSEMVNCVEDPASAPYPPSTPGTEYTGRSQPNAYPFPAHHAVNDRPSSPPPVPITPTGTAHKSDSRGEKLKKMLGDEAPASKPKLTEQPWYLGHDYSQADISFNMEGHVRGGTLPALVERLTLHDGLDSNFVATFLLTYRSFATTEQLFTLLFRRFTITPPMGLDATELEQWTEKKLTPIRLRVFNIIKSWLENYYLEDEAKDRYILPRIKEFSDSPQMRETMSFAAVQLIKLIKKRETSDWAFRKMVPNLTTQAPQPITPRNLKRIKFMDLDPLELARQLTIMEASYYNKIKPIECLAKAWTSEDPELAAKAVNIKKMIETSNLYANWIDEIVLSEMDTKKRAAIIRHLVAVAEKLRQLNNFNLLSSTTAALSQSPIHRLRRTWELVPTKTINSLAMLQALTSSAKNWADYRTELHSVNPPCVPFVGVYLTDLVMIQDGNPDFLRKTDNHINFYKRVSTAEVIREIQQYQSVAYCLTIVPEIQAFIRRGMDHSKSVAELYDMSLALEPKETEEEEMTRLLAKAGFM